MDRKLLPFFLSDPTIDQGLGLGASGGGFNLLMELRDSCRMIRDRRRFYFSPSSRLLLPAISSTVLVLIATARCIELLSAETLWRGAKFGTADPTETASNPAAATFVITKYKHK